MDKIHLIMLCTAGFLLAPPFRRLLVHDARIVIDIMILQCLNHLHPWVKPKWYANRRIRFPGVLKRTWLITLSKPCNLSFNHVLVFCLLLTWQVLCVPALCCLNRPHGQPWRVAYSEVKPTRGDALCPHNAQEASILSPYRLTSNRHSRFPLSRLPWRSPYAWIKG